MIRIVNETGNVKNTKIYLDDNEIASEFSKVEITIDAKKGVVSTVLTAPTGWCDIVITDEYVKHEKGKTDEN